MNFQTKHWIIVAALLVAIGTQIGGMEHGWHDAMAPGFVGGLLIQIGTTLAALFVGAPQKPYDGSTMPDRRQDPPA